MNAVEKSEAVMGEFHMAINKFNSEGYADPTTYQALTNVSERRRQSKNLPFAH